MKPFPHPHELVGLFEGEPQLVDAGIPWSYNHLTFITVRGNHRIECEIEPASRILKVRWLVNNCLHVLWSSRAVEGLEVEDRLGVDALRILMGKDSGMDTLRLQLKPSICLEWGMQTEGADFDMSIHSTEQT
jgi:hypothetical protein